MNYITLDKNNIDSEHICCAFSDKKCTEGYNLKKEWLKNEFENDYVFYRLAERAKVFIEYGPAENAWMPVTAPNYIMLGCFWVSGKYKGHGHGKALLNEMIAKAKEQKKDGLVAVVGEKKFPFMSDTKWLLQHGFEVIEKTPDGFMLLAMSLHSSSTKPKFNESVIKNHIDNKGIVVHYSNRCPYTEYYVNECLIETANKRNMLLSIIKLNSLQKAQTSPTPATIFSLYVDGVFVTTDISVCLDNKFDKIVSKKVPNFKDS